MDYGKTVSFLEENLKIIFAYSLSRVSNREDAEDLTNEIAAAILQSADRLKKEEAFYGYVWMIAANTWKKFLRKRNRFQTGELDETVSDGTDFTLEIVEKEERLRLRREISLLSGEYRECTVAYYFDGLSCAEISRKRNISLEMVKYYLFRTRKILKEGIGMEREFGEKSFHPQTFELNTIYAEECNGEYQSLFSRKLPGQILLCAYDAPVTVRELAVELGVAAVYLEDEIKVLERYRLISGLPSGKYQTNLIIYTEGFLEKFYREAEKFAVPSLEKILSDISGKLDEIREAASACAGLGDDRMQWPLLWMTIRFGWNRFAESKPELQKWDTLCAKSEGINYGVTRDTTQGEYGCFSFAGYAGIDESYYASAADFGILPEKNRYFGKKEGAVLSEKADRILAGKQEPEFMILSEAQTGEAEKIMEKEIAGMSALYGELFRCACSLMRVHAPGHLEGQIDRIVFKTLLFQTVGPIGCFAVKSGALALPQFDGPAALYLVRRSQGNSEASLNKLRRMAER